MQDNNQSFDRLLAKYFSHEISGEDKEQLFSMIMQSPSYREEYEKVAKLNSLLHIPAFSSYMQDDYLFLKKKAHICQDNQQGKSNIRKFTFFKYIAAAVALIVVSSFGSIYLYKSYNYQGEITNWVETSTPLGGQTRLVLPDGSVAWVNAKSELKYSPRFGKTDRLLYLEGEAYFEVKKNKELPFSVHVGNMGVTATGTQFNIRSYPDDNKWEVNLLEGGVDVLVSDRSYSLTPNEKVIYDRSSSLAIVEQTQAYMATQWIKGKLSFHQASIPEIYKMLERHFNVKIQIGSEELKEEYFLGSINLDMSLSEILSYLDVDKRYKVEIENDVIIVRKR